MRRFLRLCFLVQLLAVFSLSASCKGGAAPSNLAPVSGKVTMDGKPLPKASVRFQPDKGGGDSYGTTDDQGNYTLRWTGNQAGADGAVVSRGRASAETTSRRTSAS